MGIFTKDIKSLNDLFIHQLQDIYYAEKKILSAMPKMVEKATNPTLKDAFQMHLDETRNHVARLEDVFRMFGTEIQTTKCAAINGIIDEAEDVASEVADKDVLDAALIAAAQAVEHYEITRYGSLVAWAKRLGHDDCATVLSETLEEEKATDQKLNELAASANRMAA